MPKSVLSNFTLAHIHSTILAKETIHHAAFELGVKYTELEKYLRKFEYSTEPIAFFKNLSVANAQVRFGEIYHQVIDSITVCVSKYSLEDIHASILANPSSNATDTLGVYQYEFAEYLRKLHPHGAITPNTLEHISKENAQFIFGDAYNRIIVFPKKQLSQHTIAHVHAQIQASKDIMEAAVRFGVYYETLVVHLGKFFLNGQKLTFEILKSLTIEEAQNEFGDKYHQPMTVARRNISTYTLAEIHEVALKCDTILKITNQLGVLNDSLHYHLAKFYYQDRYLTISDLRTLSPEDAEALYGESYHQLTAIKADISLYTLNIIHQAIIQSKNCTKAAKVLMISHKTLSRHLCLARYNNQRISYDALKTMSVEEAQDYFGEAYNQPLQIIINSFYDYTIAAIHAHVRDSDHLTQAAERLSLRSDTLSIELKKFLYKDSPLTYCRFKNLSIIEAQSYWKEAYDNPFIDKWVMMKTRKRHRPKSIDVSLQSRPPLPVPPTEPEEATNPVENNAYGQELVAPLSLAGSDSALTSALSPSLFALYNESQFDLDHSFLPNFFDI